MAAEEAAVEGALALREARAQLERQLARKLTAQEVKRLFRAYEEHLIQLGFEQKPNGQWFRPRSRLERFLG